MLRLWIKKQLDCRWVFVWTPHQFILVIGNMKRDVGKKWENYVNVSVKQFTGTAKKKNLKSV